MNRRNQARNPGYDAGRLIGCPATDPFSKHPQNKPSADMKPPSAVTPADPSDKLL